MQSTRTSALASSVRAEQRRASKKAAIRHEAQRLFVGQGFDAVSMDMVAQAAGMSKVTVYKYFASKDELLTDVVVAFLDRTNRRIWPFDAMDLDLRTVLRAVATNFHDVFLAETSIAFRRMVLGVLPRFPALGQRIVEEGPNIILARLADYFRCQTAKGRVDIEDPDLAAILFHGLMLSDIELRGVFLSEAPSREEAAERVERAVDMFASYYERTR